MIGEFNFFFSKSPVYLIFHATNRCNLKCVHCFNYETRNREMDVLSLEEIDRIASNLGHVKYLTLGGGEPMLRSDIGDIPPIFYRKNGLHILNLATNGWFTDETVNFVDSVLTTCPDLKINVGVSIDGPEEMHDRLRGRQGSYERALATLSSLKKMVPGKFRRRLFVMVNGAYHAQNAGALLPVAEYCARNLGVPYYVGLIRGRVADNALKKIDIEHFRQIRRKMQTLIKEQLPLDYPFRPVRLAVDEVVADIVYHSYKYNKCLVPCLAGRKSLLLAADGTLPLCEMLDVRLGNVRQAGYDPMAILRSRAARREIRKITADKCHCTWECFQAVNVIFYPRLYPRLAVKALRNYCHRRHFD